MHDIIIIGGGISGLYAYYSLKKKYNDINVVLLEKTTILEGEYINITKTY